MNRSAHLRRVLLLCNGAPPSKSFVQGLAREAELIVAADGGANTAARCNVQPHIIIGDLDSILPATMKRFRTSMVIRVRRQDNTDLEKALDLISSSGKAEVMIVGATGGRIDFTLANLAVFWNYTASLGICFRGDGWRAVPVGRKRSLTAPIGSVVSLLPFTSCSGITLRGLRYPLRNATMRLGSIGVSNIVRTPRFDVTVRRGKMLLVVFNRRKERTRW